MAIFPIRKNEPAPISTHDTALAAWYRREKDLRANVETAQRLASGTQQRINRSAEIEARVLAIGEQLILARAAVEIGEGSRERVTELEQQRAALDSARRDAADDAAVAKIVASKHQQALEAAVAEQRAHLDAWPKLAVPVVHQNIASLAEEFDAARQAFIAAMVKIMGTALAADEIAKSGNLGLFCFPIGVSRAAQAMLDAVNLIPTLAPYSKVERDFVKEARAIADDVFRGLSR